MKPAALLLLLPLAACAADNSPRAVCARRVYDDPDVKTMMMRQAGSPGLFTTGQPALRQAEQQAKIRCLQEMGALPPGGVEPPQASFGDVTPF